MYIEPECSQSAYWPEALLGTERIETAPQSSPASVWKYRCFINVNPFRSYIFYDCDKGLVVGDNLWVGKDTENIIGALSVFYVSAVKGQHEAVVTGKLNIECFGR